MTGPGRILRLGAAVLLAGLALVPIVNWIPGGHSYANYALEFDGWWSGTLVALGAGVVLALLSRRSPGLWRSGEWGRRAAAARLTSPGPAALVALGATFLYVLVARTIFGGRPLLIDEIVQVWQARVYASGRLWLPTTGAPDLFGATNIVEHAGKVFGQFPAGGPAMLALGALVHAEWLVDPVFAGLAVYGWATILRRSGEAPATATTALLLFALSPFAVFMSASHMNHVTTLAWIMIGMAGLVIVTGSERPRPLVALGLGLAFGLAGSIRPVDALAFGAPAGLWLAARALKDRARLGECALAALGMAIPLGATLWVNAQTTGHPLLFGYTLLWGPGHDLGFHHVPWGPPHTAARGLELVNLYLLELQSYFLETPFPSLLPALAVLALGTRLRPFDRYLATSSALIIGLYFAYWHNGYFLGPRFLYPLLPVLAIWTARFGALLRERWGTDALPNRVWVYTALTSVMMAATWSLPYRVRQYRETSFSQRWPAAEAARAAGAEQALVLVRESWGAQSIARMWGLGVPRSQAEFVYGRSDMCALHTTLGRLERAGVRDSAATAALLSVTADSAALVDSVLSADRSERLLPGSSYTPECVARWHDDARGFTLYPPLLLDDRSGNVYARDLHARDTLALLEYPDRPLFLLVPPDTALGRFPEFRPIRRDSLLADWGLPRDWGRER